MYGGTTVEVLNTDAEGRLILADALVRATEQKPDVILDVATLTGHMVVALGDRVAGVMGSDDIVDGVLAAGEDAGEELWPMPIPEAMDERIQSSKIADLAQHDWIRWGGGLFAAAFLREFTAGLPWAHLDIAGPAFNSGGPYGHVTSGGTGFAVTTLVDYARSLTESTPSVTTWLALGPTAERFVTDGERSRGPAASCGGCSRASAAGCRRRRRRTTGPGGWLQNLCAHSTDGTRRRVHSPSWATSSRVTSLTAVRGSTNPSTPRRAGTNCCRCVLVDRVGGAHPGRTGAGGVARGRAHLGARAPPEPVDNPMRPSVPCRRSGRVMPRQDRCGHVRRSAKMDRTARSGTATDLRDGRTSVAEADFDVLILGAGSGGYACALRAAQLGLSVGLVEKGNLGGTCLHVGCIPTKALLHAAEVADTARESEQFGVQATLDGIDMAGVNAYKDGVVSRLFKGLTGLIKGRGITVIEGEGRLTGPREVTVDGTTYSGKHVVLATGSYSRSLPGLDIDGERVDHLRAGAAARPGAGVGGRARRRRDRLRVRQRLAQLRRRGDHRRGAAPAGRRRGRGVVQGARAGVPQARDRVHAPARRSRASRPPTTASP